MSVRAWLQLLRFPNLFTVPGDPLAGFLLASGGELRWRVAWAILASLSFYAAGLLLNDVLDLAEDRRERPSRPLPSGALRLREVWLATVILALSGLLLCRLGGCLAMAVGVILLIAIVSYNGWTKQLPVLGALNMGLCRGLNILLGAAFVFAPQLPTFAEVPVLTFIAAGVELIYIAVITHLARGETRDPSIPLRIGQLIRLLIPLQAAYCLASLSIAGLVSAGCLLILWPLAGLASRRFYAS